MSKKVILFSVIFVFFLCFRSVFASLYINEVMYDLQGSDSTNGKSREWIEVYNSGPSDVNIDASSFRIYDGSANRTINGGVNFSIPTNSYIIFVGNKDTFISDHPNFTGTVYDTGITSLNNTGTTLKILDQSSSVIDSFTYASSMGGAGDGNSLQKIGGNWVGASPTPGASNDSNGSSVSVNSSVSGAPLVSTEEISKIPSLTASNTESKNKKTEDAKIKTQILGNKFAFKGIPIILQALTTGVNKQPVISGKYFWNFGDGDFREIKINNFNAGDKISHTYYYSGDYIVTLEYYQNPYSDAPDTTDRITIDAVVPEISISNTGDATDFFIQLTNNTQYDADISNWSIVSLAKIFTIPRNTILESKKNIIFSAKVTNFSLADKENLKLLNREGGLVAQEKTEAKIDPKLDMKIENKEINTTKQVVQNTKEIDTPQPIVNNNINPDLSASVVATNSDNYFNFKFNFFFTSIFIILSAIAVYSVRRYKKNSSPLDIKNGDDFTILDE